MAESYFFSRPAWLKEILADSFKKNVILFLCLLGLGLYSFEKYHDAASRPQDNQITFFFHPQCPHCKRQKEFTPTSRKNPTALLIRCD